MRVTSIFVLALAVLGFSTVAYAALDCSAALIPTVEQSQSDYTMLQAYMFLNAEAEYDRLKTMYKSGREQGHSVFEFNPDESQRLSWLGCQPAACRRDIRMARPPQQPNRGVAKRCHDLGDTATAHL